MWCIKDACFYPLQDTHGSTKGKTGIVDKVQDLPDELRFRSLCMVLSPILSPILQPDCRVIPQGLECFVRKVNLAYAIGADRWIREMVIEQT